MKKSSIHFVLGILLIIGVSVSDVFSRSSSSSSSRSSSSSSSRSSSGSSFRSSSSTIKSTPAPRPTATPKKTVAPTRSTTKPSTIKSASSPATPKPKAVSTSAIDKQKAKATAQSNKAAVKKYKSKAEAEQACRQKLASSNSYASPTPPAVTPSHVPKTIIINNNPAPTSYGAFPGGGYGYGYYNPITNAFVALAVADMIVDHNTLQNSGYGRWRDDGRPVQQTSAAGAIIGIFVVLLVVGGIVLAIKKFS
jgi:hypothetical protein